MEILLLILTIYVLPYYFVKNQYKNKKISRSSYLLLTFLTPLLIGFISIFVLNILPASGAAEGLYRFLLMVWIFLFGAIFYIYLAVHITFQFYFRVTKENNNQNRKKKYIFLIVIIFILLGLLILSRIARYGFTKQQSTTIVDEKGVIIEEVIE